MSTVEPEIDQPFRPRDVVGGFLIAVSIFVGAIGVVHLPVRLIPAAIVLGLVGAVMTDRYRRLGVLAAWLGVVWWVVGMTIAVLADRPLY